MGFAHAQWNFHGQILSDINDQRFQKTNADTDVPSLDRTSPVAQVSTFFLDTSYSMRKNMTAHMRVGRTAYQEENFWDDRLFYITDTAEPQILAAYIDAKIGKGLTICAGKMPLNVLNSTRNHPLKSTIDPALNQILALNGNKIGLSALTNFYPLVVQTSIWNQTAIQPIREISGTEFDQLTSFSQLAPQWTNQVLLSTDYHDRAFKLGYSASFAFVPSEYDDIGSSFSASFLVAPLNMPYIVATLGSLSPETSVGLSLYNYFSNYQASYIAFWKNLALTLNMEYAHFSMAEDSLFGSADYSGALVFQEDPVAVSYGALLTYTFAKPSSKFEIDRTSGGFSRKPSGWTIGCGFSSKTQKDAFALLSTIGQNDWLNSEYTYISGSGRLADDIYIDTENLENGYRQISIDNTLSGDNPGGNNNPYASLGNLNAQGDPEHAFQIKSKSLTFVLNYQFSENLEWKNELTYTEHKKLIFGEDYFDSSNEQSAYANSINWYKTGTFRTQVAVFF